MNDRLAAGVLLAMLLLGVTGTCSGPPLRFACERPSVLPECAGRPR